VLTAYSYGYKLSQAFKVKVEKYNPFSVTLYGVKSMLPLFAYCRILLKMGDFYLVVRRPFNKKSRLKPTILLASSHHLMSSPRTIASNLNLISNKLFGQGVKRLTVRKHMKRSETLLDMEKVIREVMPKGTAIKALDFKICCKFIITNPLTGKSLTTETYLSPLWKQEVKCVIYENLMDSL